MSEIQLTHDSSLSYGHDQSRFYSLHGFPRDSRRLRGRNADDKVERQPLPRRTDVRRGVRAELRHVRPLRQGAHDRGLESHCRRHRPPGRRRRDDGDLRELRPAPMVGRGPAPPQDDRDLRRRPDRGRAVVLLQRGRPPVGRSRAAPGVHRADPRGRLALGHHGPAPHRPHTGWRRAGHRGNHAGARRLQRRPHQRGRRHLGGGLRGLRSVLLHDERHHGCHPGHRTAAPDHTTPAA